MKLNINKLLTLCTAFCLLLTGAITGLAEEAGVQPTTQGEITLHTGKHDVSSTTFDLYKVFDVTTDGKNVSYVINSKFENFFNEELSKEKATNEDAYKHIKDNASNPEFQMKLKQYIVNNVVTKADTIQGTVEKTYKTKKLDFGFYVIVPSGTQFTLTYTTLTATVQDVYLKGVLPTVDKKVDDKDWNSAQVGDTVHFKVISMVPDMTGFQQYHFKMVDTMDEGLTLDENSLNLAVSIGGETLTNPDDFSTVIAGQQLTVTINNFIKYAPKANEEIVFAYDAVLNEKAIIKDNVTNTANVHWGNDPEHLNDGTPDTVKVFAHTLTITKKDNLQQVLPGALFELYRGTVEEQNKVEFVDLNDGTYRVAVASDQTKTSTVISPVNGVITIKGLDEGEFKLVETKAPDGFNKLKDPITITIIADSLDNGVNVTVTGNTISVVNNPGTLLPETGGMGTVMFTVVGVVGILAVAYSFRPKKSK